MFVRSECSCFAALGNVALLLHCKSGLFLEKCFAVYLLLAVYRRSTLQLFTRAVFEPQLHATAKCAHRV